MAYTKAALHKAALSFYFQILRAEDLIIQKLRKGNIETFCEHHYGAQRNRFISSVHYTLHASVLYARLLLQAVLGHILFSQQLANTLCNSIIYSQANTSNKQFDFRSFTYILYFIKKSKKL